MNPAKVAANRTARLAREANTPVYTTKTGDKPKAAKPKPVKFDQHALCVHSIGYCDGEKD